jgi:hypothetical protein
VAPDSAGNAFVPEAYYRFTKNEAGNAASDVFSEKNTNLLSASTVVLANGAVRLARPVAVALATTQWTGPVSNDVIAIGLTQSIGASEPLRTGSYSGNLTVTLTTTPP